MIAEAVQTPRYRATFSRLMRFLWPYRVSLVVSIVLAIGSQLAALAIPWLTGKRRRGDPGRRAEPAPVAGRGRARGRARHGADDGRSPPDLGQQALGVELDMRNAIYAKLVRLSFGYFDRHQTGQLMSRATVDLQSVRFFLGYGLIFFFQHVFTIVGVGILLFVISWKLALIALAISAGAGRGRLPLQPASRTRCSATCSRRWPTSRRSPRRTSSASTSSSRSRRSRPSRTSSSGAPRRSSPRASARTGSGRSTCRCSSFLPLLAQAAVLLVGGKMVADGSLSLGRLRRASTSTSRCSSSRCGCSGCGSARASARRRPASGSSR